MPVNEGPTPAEGPRREPARSLSPARLRSVPPDERRHPPALSIAPIGEKPRRIRVGAPAAAGDITDAKRLESLPRERVEITLPTTPRVGLESRRRTRIVRHERGAHLVTDLEVLLTDSRPEPCNKLRRRNAQMAHSLLQHAAREPPPPRMSRAHRRPSTRRKQHRHTVSDLNNTHPPTHPRNRRIRTRKP
jgi:hypothetical protein